MITISSDTVSVKVSGKGAELQSLRYNGLEYLWQANAEYWGKHSPVLFPFIGELKDGKYIFEDVKYTMPRHGFARDRIFEAIQTSGASATFTLNSDDTTLAIYPFRFIFKVEYRLEGNGLFCSYIVENAGTSVMYFSAGGHPAFNVPLQSNLHYSDYKLRFDNDAVLTRYLLRNGLTSNDTEEISLLNNELALQPSLFYTDAIVLKSINSSKVKLFTDKDTHGLTFTFGDFPYFGIWAAKDAPFVCLEPWCGIADNINHDHQLINKEGINQLAPGETWQRTWIVEVF